MDVIGINRLRFGQAIAPLLLPIFCSGLALACTPPPDQLRSYDELDEIWGAESVIFVAEIIDVEAYTDEIKNLCLSTSYHVYQVIWGQAPSELTVVLCSDRPRPELEPDSVPSVLLESDEGDGGIRFDAEYLVRLYRDADHPNGLRYASSCIWPFRIRLDTMEPSERAQLLTHILDVAASRRSLGE